MPRLQGCRGLVHPKVCIHILRISQIFPLKFLWVPIPPRTGLPSLGHDFPPHWGFVQKHISYFEGKWVWYDGLCKHNFELACYSLLDSGEEAKVKGTRKVGGAGKKGRVRAPSLSSFLPFYFRVRAFSIQRARLSRSLEKAKSWAYA